MIAPAALLLAAAPALPPPEPPRAGVSVTARAGVEILRAERAEPSPDPERPERKARRTPQGLLVEFT